MKKPGIVREEAEAELPEAYQWYATSAWNSQSADLRVVTYFIRGDFICSTVMKNECNYWLHKSAENIIDILWLRKMH